MRDDQGLGIFDVGLEGRFQLHELSFCDQLLPQKSLAQVLDKVQEDRAATMSWRIDVHERMDLDVDEACLT